MNQDEILKSIQVTHKKSKTNKQRNNDPVETNRKQQNGKLN